MGHLSAATRLFLLVGYLVVIPRLAKDTDMLRLPCLACEGLISPSWPSPPGLAFRLKRSAVLRGPLRPAPYRSSRSSSSQYSQVRSTGPRQPSSSFLRISAASSSEGMRESTATQERSGSALLVLRRLVALVTHTALEFAKEEDLKARTLGTDWSRVSLWSLDRILEVEVPWSDIRLLVAPGCRIARELRATDPRPGRVWCVCEVGNLLLSGVIPEDARKIAEAKLTFDAEVSGVASQSVRKVGDA